MKFRAWISALRLRTLPLALATVGTGTFLAIQHQKFDWNIFAWAVLTTVLLQVLSNLANDYGDSQHGADSEHRVGPERAVQSGIISSSEMRVGIIVLVLLSLLSGIMLLNVAFGLGSKQFFIFLGIGILSIIAAYTYTAGKRPYGYAGLGDLMVLIFFGLVGVGGSYYLFDSVVEISILLPALAIGLLATGVLNINNMRDLESDELAGKITIPVRLGFTKAKSYHYVLLVSAIVLSTGYLIYSGPGLASLIFLPALPLIIINLFQVSRADGGAKLDPLLKQLAIATFLFMIFFGLAIAL